MKSVYLSVLHRLRNQRNQDFDSIFSKYVSFVVYCNRGNFFLDFKQNFYGAMYCLVYTTMNVRAIQVCAIEIQFQNGAKSVHPFQFLRNHRFQYSKIFLQEGANFALLPLKSMENSYFSLKNTHFWMASFQCPLGKRPK